MNKVETNVSELINKCVNVILKYQQPSGAYPASPNFNNYKYCWFRDGSFIADGMSRAGQVESAELFFDWCSQIIVKRKEQILNGGKLDARYKYNGEESQEKWETFQLDGYGTWLWTVKNHASRHNRSHSRYKEATDLIQHYLVTNWQEPCFDWWEERKGIHATSLGCIYAGLKAYNNPEATKVKKTINLNNERTDSSLLICGIFSASDKSEFAPMLKCIEAELISPSGGVYRYKKDDYYGGGEWPVLTNMLGWYYTQIGRQKDAKDKLNWTISHMQNNGWLAEQSQDNLLHPKNYDPWVKKWGEPANPLLWSNAMFLTLATSLENG